MIKFPRNQNREFNPSNKQIIFSSAKNQGRQNAVEDDRRGPEYSTCPWNKCTAHSVPANLLVGELMSISEDSDRPASHATLTDLMRWFGADGAKLALNGFSKSLLNAWNRPLRLRQLS